MENGPSVYLLRWADFDRSINIDPGGFAITAVVRVERSSGLSLPSFKEIWEYRELIYFLAWRDIKVRYKQTALGATWAVIQPLMTMVVFSIFFGVLAKMPSDGAPYPIFAYSALVPWTYFANSLAQTISSMVSGQSLIQRVYFPRIILPLASLLSGLVDFAIAFAVLLALMIYYGILPTLNMLLLPILLLFEIVTALGVGLWLATMNVVYRDVGYVTPFMIQFWLFATPIAYPSSLIPVQWRPLYGINPMTGVVEGFRWAVLGGGIGFEPTIVVSVIISLVVLATGLVYFRHYERTFADLV